MIEQIYQLSIREQNMARFMISMPDEMLKKLDETARKEHRSRSELLREAARRHLTEASVRPPAGDGNQSVKRKSSTRSPRGPARQDMLRRGIGQTGCAGLERLVGAVKAPPEMRKLLKIGKKLSGLSRDIVEAREDRW
jgi:Arc/MetJ-type ribon-helix-helix transcriptional regulator